MGLKGLIAFVLSATFAWAGLFSSAQDDLFEAVSKGGSLSDMVTAVNKGANVNGFDAEGWTPLHAAITWLSLPKVQYLLSVGANPNAQTFSDHFTPLGMALDENQPLMVEELLKAKANPNALSSQSFPQWPLEIALSNASRDEEDVRRQHYGHERRSLAQYRSDALICIKLLVRYGAKGDALSHTYPDKTVLGSIKDPAIRQLLLP